MVILSSMTVTFGQLDLVPKGWFPESERMVILFEQAKQFAIQKNWHQAIQIWKQVFEIACEIDKHRSEYYLKISIDPSTDPKAQLARQLSPYAIAGLLQIGRDRKVIIATLACIGQAYLSLGYYPEAIYYFEYSLKVNEEWSKIEPYLDEAKAAGSFALLGGIYYDLGNYAEAISYYEKAKEIAGRKETYYHLGNKQERNVVPDGKRLVGTALSMLGDINVTIGNYEESINFKEKAMEIRKQVYEEVGDKRSALDLASNLLSMGQTYCYYLADYKNAIHYFEQALEFSKKISNKEWPTQEDRALDESGWVILSTDETINWTFGPEDKQLVAASLSDLGIAYSLLGEYKQAISYHEKALEIHKEVGDKKGVACQLESIGLLYAQLGDSAKAISCCEKALAITKELEEKRWAANILWYLNYLRKNPSREYTKMIEYLEQSLKEHLQKRIADELFSDYLALGSIYETLKEHSKAREKYEEAVAMIEEQRETLAEAEKGKWHSVGELTTKFFVAKNRKQPYEGMVRMLLAADETDNAFFYSENLKARVLSEAIARGHLTEAHVLPEALANEENDFITQIRGLRKQMEALYKNKAMDIYAEKETNLKQVKAEQQQFIARLRQSHPEYAAVHYPQPIKPQEVLLNPDEALIEFEVTNNATLVFLLKDKQVKTRSIDIARDSLEQLVLNYRGYFENIRQTSQLGKYDPRVGNKLYELLFGDLLASIPAGTTLIIVADEILGILPFEALVTELPAAEKMGESEFGPFPLGVSYLDDSYPISYAQSATSLTLLRNLKKGSGKGEQILVVADPIFSANDSRLGALAQAKMSEDKMNLMGALVDWKQMGVKGIRLRDEQRASAVDADAIFPRLEKTTVLAQSVQALFGKNAVVFSGSQASEEKIRAMDLSQYRYLTFATHGILDRTVPYIQEPALVLTQIGNPEGYDGFLTMSEVMGLKLEAEVVALTACETGVGKRVSGEGVMGMGRAFQYAGAQNVLVSLWSVAETSATDLTAAFFSYVKEGKEPKEAIRLARNEIRHKGYEHPFYWASFILFGK